ncbi:hypothetical protein [Geoalkalibacter sp.]|uniref:hypothetical protein n=1 Tax=Geoalkalibacter sp. TaxID=3041440 RepID=UPI00272EE050|nr:hypothetical protein [Geoalkalibacter sp.]
MSSILKALKKLEEQKANKEEGAVNIARDILRTSRKAKKIENWILPTAIAALLLTAGMGGYVLFGGFSSPKPEEVAIPAPPAEVAATPATPVVDRPEMLFSAGENQPAPAEEGSATATADESVAVVAEPGASEVTTAQQETAAALKDTAQALKDTAEALKDKVVFPKEVVVVSPDKTETGRADTLVAVREPAPAPAKPVAATPKPAAKAETKSPATTTSTSAAPKPAAKTAATAPKPKTAPATPVAEGNVRVLYRAPDAPASITAPRQAPAQANVYRPSGTAVTTATAPRQSAPATTGTTARSTSRTAPVLAATFPELRVSEIHYQYDVKNRLAVVNDLPVMEGTIIEGVKVDRILPDRVRFALNGQYREIRLTQ